MIRYIEKNFIESLVADGLPIYFIAEENYTDLANGEEGNLYKIVFAAVSTLAAMRSYLHRHVLTQCQVLLQFSAIE